MNPPLITVSSDEAGAALLEKNAVPIIAEITPRPDPVYGHTFTWPAEVAQLFNTPPVRRGKMGGG